MRWSNLDAIPVGVFVIGRSAKRYSYLAANREYRQLVAPASYRAGIDPARYLRNGRAQRLLAGLDYCSETHRSFTFHEMIERNSQCRWFLTTLVPQTTKHSVARIFGTTHEPLKSLQVLLKYEI